MAPLLLGIDVGTSFVKGVLTTPDGRVVAQASAGYATNHPRPGWAEQDPHDWWRGVVAVTHEVLAAADREPGTAVEVAGIGVSGQGCAVTLIGARGEALHPAIIWMDNRSEPQCERLRQECASEILHINGKSPAPYNADPVLIWLQQHAPELLDATRCSLTTTGYVNFRLTGRAVTNASDASILFAYDLAHGRWSPELLTAFGLPARLYPEVRPCQEVIGGLIAEAAAELGLPAGIPVIAGGEDTSSAGLALGAVRPGMAFLSLGTAGTLYATEPRPRVHPQLLTFAHVLEHQFLVGGSMGAIGAALAWLRTAFGDQRIQTPQHRIPHQLGQALGQTERVQDQDRSPTPGSCPEGQQQVIDLGQSDQRRPGGLEQSRDQHVQGLTRPLRADHPRGPVIGHPQRSPAPGMTGGPQPPPDLARVLQPPARRDTTRDLLPQRGNRHGRKGFRWVVSRGQVGAHDGSHRFQPLLAHESAGLRP